MAASFLCIAWKFSDFGLAKEDGVSCAPHVRHEACDGTDRQRQERARRRLSNIPSRQGTWTMASVRMTRARSLKNGVDQEAPGQ